MKPLPENTQATLETIAKNAPNPEHMMTALRAAYWLGVLDATTDALKEVRARREQLAKEAA